MLASVRKSLNSISLCGRQTLLSLTKVFNQEFLVITSSRAITFSCAVPGQYHYHGYSCCWGGSYFNACWCQHACSCYRVCSSYHVYSCMQSKAQARAARTARAARPPRAHRSPHALPPLRLPAPTTPPVAPRTLKARNY